MKRSRSLMLGMSLLVTVAGCRSLAPPSFLQPGTAEYQQQRAQQFDPYPENDPGPAIVGARPLEYENARAEVQRARWYLPWTWGS